MLSGEGEPPASHFIAGLHGCVAAGAQGCPGAAHDAKDRGRV